MSTSKQLKHLPKAVSRFKRDYRSEASKKTLEPYTGDPTPSEPLFKYNNMYYKIVDDTGGGSGSGDGKSSGAPTSPTPEPISKGKSSPSTKEPEEVTDPISEAISKINKSLKDSTSKEIFGSVPNPDGHGHDGKFHSRKTTDEVLEDRNIPMDFKLKKIFKDNKTAKMSRFKENGQVDGKRLSKVITGQKNIFRKRKVDIKGKDYIVYFLVDRSGSMFGNREIVAKETVRGICTNLEKAGVDSEVWSFGDDITIEKDQKTKVKDAKLDWTSNQNNADGGAVNFMLNLIRKDQHKIRILFCISDGDYCQYKIRTKDGKSIDWISQKDAILLAKKLKIGLASLGIQRSAYDFPINNNINTLEEMRGCVASMVSQAIKANKSRI